MPSLRSPLQLSQAGTNSEGSMPEKGQPIFLDYSQAALDAAYDQAAYAPNREQLIKRRISDSELVRLYVGEPERVAGRPAAPSQGFLRIPLGETKVFGVLPIICRPRS